MRKVLSFILLLCSTALFGQRFVSDYSFTEYHNVNNKEIKLNNTYIIENSEYVKLDSLNLYRGRDYTMEYKKGLLLLSDSLISYTDFIQVEYRTIPLEYLETLYLYKVSTVNDTLIITPRAKVSNYLLDNNRLSINGSKTFALSYSNSDDFDLQQSLFLKLSGEIAKGVNIQAQLSDSNSPISPEGNSRELSSLDKIFIKVYNKHFEIAFGDLEYTMDNSKYMNYKPKFQGLKFGLYEDNNQEYWGNFNRQNRVVGAIAVSSGKNSSYKFSCIEGKQGPYFIYIPNQSTNVSIIAGSEELFINGEAVVRGEDYSIDYSEGSVTFENLVTSETDIYITFEYTEEKYRNNLYMTSSSYTYSDFFNVQFNMLLRADDEDNPLEDTHTNEDIEAFQATGDADVHANGVYEVDLGTGHYISTTSSEGLLYYEYVGPDSTGVYNIFFSDVGIGNGSYNEFSPSKYEFVGIGYGDFEPIRVLASPKRMENYDILMRFGSEKFYLELESLLSNYDKNTLSSLDDSDNDGIISNIGINYAIDSDMASLKSSFNAEYKSANAITFSDLENPTELSHTDIATTNDSLKSHNYALKNFFNYKNIGSTTVNINQREINSLNKSNYLQTNVNLKEHTFFPKFYYQYISSITDYLDSDLEKNSYFSNHFNLQKRVLFVTTGFEVNSNKSKDNYNNNLSLGYKYLKYNYTLLSDNLKFFNFKSTYSTDETKVLQDDSWDKSSDSYTTATELLFSFAEHSANAQYTHRKLKQYSQDSNDEEFDMISFNANNSFYNHGIDVNSNYKINNIEFYPKVRELQFIGENAGSYDSLGVYQNEGDYDWFYVNSGEPELSTELSCNLNLYLRLNRFLTTSLWKNLNSEFRFLISENSKASDKMKLYLLNPSVLMNEDNTIYGRQNFINTYFYSTNSKKINYRVSFELDKTLDNRYQDEDKTTLKSMENELTLKRLSIGNLAFEHIYSKEEDTRYNSVITNNIITTKYKKNLSPSILYNSNLSLDIEDGEKSSDDDNYSLYVISLNNIITSNISRKYLLQLNTTISNTTRSGSEYLSFLAEKRDGVAFKWSLTSKYSYSKYITINFSYSGDKYPQDRTNQKINMEIKAEF